MYFTFPPSLFPDNELSDYNTVMLANYQYLIYTKRVEIYLSSHKIQSNTTAGVRVSVCVCVCV